ncbi:sporocyteless like protein [Tanacetum coccineum]
MTTSSIPNDTSSGPKHISVSGASGQSRKAKNDSSSSSLKKKIQPQRGMGIEKLERILLQERWKKMTDIVPPPPPSPFNNTFAVPHHQLNGPFQFHQPPVNYFNGVVGDDLYHVYQHMTTTNVLYSIQNSYVKCLSDGYGACYKKIRINGGGSSTCSVNPCRNYAASNNAFVETIDAVATC